jgi:hypothetical protein
MTALFVELVCGLPGSGKTTYCEGKRQFVETFHGGDRRVVLVNLDPANDGQFPYPCDIDVAQLIQRDVVMEAETLGPNGSYLFCIDYIAEHVDWLIGEIRGAVTVHSQSPIAAKPLWCLVDCPGQVEFYVHSEGLRGVVHALLKSLRATVVMTHLCDAVIATRDVPTYVSTCLLSLSCMVDLELPHVNVLTKWDCVVGEDGDDEERAPYLDTANFLSDHFNRMWSRQARERGTLINPRLRKMANALMEVVDGYSLVGYECLDVQSETLMRSVCDRVDMAAGYIS